jgi:hypothetical protein
MLEYGHSTSLGSRQDKRGKMRKLARAGILSLFSLVAMM